MFLPYLLVKGLDIVSGIIGHCLHDCDIVASCTILLSYFLVEGMLTLRKLCTIEFKDTALHIC